jgi:hypothetical protein
MTRLSFATLRRAFPRIATLQEGISSLGRTVRVAASTLAILTGAVAPAAAQKYQMNITAGSPVAFTSPTEADFDAGFKLATTNLSFNVDSKNGAAVLRNTTVSIRASSGVMGGSKPIGDFQWRRLDLGGAWNSLTTTDVVVESRDVVRNGLNDPWGNSVEFRVVLDWATTPPATYTPGLVLTLTVSPP